MNIMKRIFVIGPMAVGIFISRSVVNVPKAAAAANDEDCFYVDYGGGWVMHECPEAGQNFNHMSQ